MLENPLKIFELLGVVPASLLLDKVEINQFGKQVITHLTYQFYAEDLYTPAMEKHFKVAFDKCDYVSWEMSEPDEIDLEPPLDVMGTRSQPSSRLLVSKLSSNVIASLLKAQIHDKLHLSRGLDNVIVGSRNLGKEAEHVREINRFHRRWSCYTQHIGETAKSGEISRYCLCERY